MDIELARRGDRQAFERLAERYLPELYRLATVMVGEDEAPDVTQETLVAVWRELPRLREMDRFPSWLRSIHMNRCRNALRSRRRRPATHMSALPDLGDVLDRWGTDEPMSRLHSSWAVDEALRSLPIDERAVFALHYVADLTLRDAARALGIPEGTAKTRLHSGLLRLRRLLEGGEQEVVA